VQSATVRTGKLFGEKVGVSAPGYRADLMVLAVDSRAGLTALRRLVRVVACGRVHDPPGATIEEYGSVLA
jgi:cytosine/adenosine deaminase-related metal-dependent hydrolase